MGESASTLQIAGAIGFGMLIGWNVYYVNRYRTDEVRVKDVATLVTAIGGAAVLTLFPTKSELFGAYGVGLFVGFFGYFLVMVILVSKTEGWGAEWFLDGRRPRPKDNEVGGDTSGRPMGKDRG